MNDTVFCPNCGTRISARARFCPSCGARQDEFHVEPAPPSAAAPPAEPLRLEPPPPVVEPEPPPRPPRVEDRIGQVDPHAGELSALIRQRLALPGIVAAAIAASVSAGIVLAAGLLIALITPDVSLVGLMGVDANIVTEAFRQALGTALTPMLDPNPGSIISGARRLHPLIALAIPLGALIWTTRWQLHRTEGAPPLARIGWAMAVALPFGLLMLAFAIVGGNSEAREIDVSAGNAFALGVLWGLVGGLIGALTKVPLSDTVTLPPLVDKLRVAVLATLRPLAALLVTCTAIALVGWLVQVGSLVSVRADRSAPTALIEETAFAGEHGIHLTALAAGARFRADADGPLGLPFPVERANDVPGNDGAFRIFAYNDVLPAYVLLPALVILLGLTTLAALYAGFAAARAVHAASLIPAAGWGALTGPAWAIVMAVLAILAGGLYHGDADDASVFGVYLFFGAILGAAGGALAASGQSSEDAPPASS